MLRCVYTFLDKILPASPPPPPFTQRYQALRREAAGQHELIPTYLFDPIDEEPIDNPIVIDEHHIIDQRTYLALQRRAKDTNSPLLNPFTRTEIVLDLEHYQPIALDFSVAQHSFILSLETIARLKSQVENAETRSIPIDDNITHQDYDKRLNQAIAENRLNILESKLNLIKEISQFIKNTKVLIEKTFEPGKERDEEITRVLTPEKNLYDEAIKKFNAFATVEEKKQVGSFEEITLIEKAGPVRLLANRFFAPPRSMLLPLPSYLLRPLAS